MENNALQLREQSTGLIAILTDTDTSRQFEKGLTLERIVADAIPMSELRRAVGTRQVAIALDIQLTRLVANLNLKWSLNDAQIKTIVEDLLEKYPTESLEDFVLCFKKARQGEYGELIRLDGPIIFTWMKSYLEEKYKVVEKKLMDERDEYYKTFVPENSERDWLAEWQDAVNKGDGMKLVPHLTDDEINEEGKEKPKRKVYRYNESEAEIMLREHHEKLWQLQERTVRERHPEFTEEEIQARLLQLKNTILENESKPKHPFTAIGKIWAEKKKKRTA